MLRCNHYTLETYHLHEWIGVGILGMLEIYYFLLVLVYIKINNEDSFLFNNRAYKILRYFLGLQMILVMFFLPLYILYTFKDCHCCHDTRNLFDMIPLIPYCIALTFFLFAYTFSFENMKHHKPTLGFYATFFFSQLILYFSTIIIVGSKVAGAYENHTHEEKECTLLNIFTNCRMEPIMMDYILPTSLLLLPCLIFSAESVCFLTNTKEKILISNQKQLSRRNNKSKTELV